MRSRLVSSRGARGSALPYVVALLVGLVGAPLPSSIDSPFELQFALAQDSLQKQIEQSKTRLDQIRAERERLRNEMGQLAGQVHDETEAINNLIKRIKRIGFGFRQLRNYRIRALLYAGRPNWSLLGTITPRSNPMSHETRSGLHDDP